jgi:hypothetical protein
MFLHHVDFDRRLVTFVKVGRELLDATNRHTFDDIEPKYGVDLESLLEAAARRDFRPPHFLFMTDFCGSTLLANALRKIDGIDCLFEVRAFADLAIRKRLLDRAPASPATTAGLDDWQRALRLVVLSMAGRSRRDALIVKEWPPTNYIISDILCCHGDISAIFLYSELEDYLNAVFRRRWRREFTRLRLVTELVETDLWPMIHEHKRSFSDGETAAAHWFVQQQMYLRIDPSGLPGIRSLNSAEFYHHPAETLAAVARHFGIDITREYAAAAFASVSDRHSKNMDIPYSIAERNRDVERTAQAHGREIAQALVQAEKWLAVCPVPQPLPWALRPAHEAAGKEKFRASCTGNVWSTSESRPPRKAESLEDEGSGP